MPQKATKDSADRCLEYRCGRSNQHSRQIANRPDPRIVFHADKLLCRVKAMPITDSGAICGLVLGSSCDGGPLLVQHRESPMQHEGRITRHVGSMHAIFGECLLSEGHGMG